MTKTNARRQLATLLIGTVGLVAGLPARADVIEVASDGTSLVSSGAGSVRCMGGDVPETVATDGLEIPADLEVPAGAALPTGSRAPAIYTAAVQRIAAKYGISPALLEAVAWHESRWQANAVSRVGAVGLTQLMPATARALGVDPRDPVANLEGGARFLRMMLDTFDGDVERALAAYDAGPARVLKAGGIPNIAETRDYVAAIIRRLSSTPTGE